MKKAPYYNSPSIPSFRIFDFEDDLGNYVEDPKRRRPVGPVSGTACPIDRVIFVIRHAVSNDMHQKDNSVVHIFAISYSSLAKSSYCMYIHFCTYLVCVAAAENNFYFRSESWC